MDGALIAVKDLLGPYRTGRADLHGARVRAPIEDPSHGVSIKGARRDGLAQQPGRILLGKKRFQTLQRAAAAESIEDHPQDHGPWIDGHRG